MACEIKITLKNDEKSLTKKGYTSQQVTADFEDKTIDSMLADAMQEFDDEVKKKTVTIKLINDDE